MMRSVPVEEMICLPQPSAFSLAASRLGWSLQDTSLVSVHGRALENVIRYLQPAARILALAWDGETPAKLARMLVERDLGASGMIVCEALGGERERIRRTTAAGFDLEDVAALNTIGLEIAGAPSAALSASRPASMTRRSRTTDGSPSAEVRAADSALAPRQGELLWDVGLGAVRSPSNGCCGIRRCARSASKPTRRAGQATRNAAALGAPDLQIVHGRAPETFAGQPAPDVVFIGGGLSNPSLFEAAWEALKPGGRIVANGVSLATEARLIGYFGRHGGELVRLEISRAGKAGSGDVFVWRPAAPIVQWRARKP